MGLFGGRQRSPLVHSFARNLVAFARATLSHFALWLKPRKMGMGFSHPLGGFVQ
jgi:hypothetical protein